MDWEDRLDDWEMELELGARLDGSDWVTLEKAAADRALMTGSSPPAAVLTWSDVTARRMGRHALTAPATDLGPAEVARVLCGAHAQVPSAAELSIGRRIAGATRTAVRRALWVERTLVKTFGPRGTIHLLPAADLPMWTGALSALPSSVPAHPEGVRFSPEEADEVIAAIGAVLAGTELTVDELTEVGRLARRCRHRDRQHGQRQRGGQARGAGRDGAGACRLNDPSGVIRDAWPADRLAWPWNTES